MLFLRHLWVIQNGRYFLSRSIWEALYDCSEGETLALEEVLEAELEPCFDEEAGTEVDFSAFWVESEPEEVRLYEYAFETDGEEEGDEVMSTLPEELRKARMDPEFHPEALRLMIEVEQAMIRHPDKDKLLQMPFPALSERKVDDECLECLHSLVENFRKIENARYTETTWRIGFRPHFAYRQWPFAPNQNFGAPPCQNSDSWTNFGIIS